MSNSERRDYDPAEVIKSGKAILGLELGSTRIKATIIGPDSRPLAAGSYGWENKLKGGVWTYDMEDVSTGLSACFEDLIKNSEESYGVTLESFAAGGTSGRSLGLRFFDTSANAENAFLVLLDPNLDGRLSVESELDIVASELYAKALFMEGSDYRVELVGGYSYFNIEDSLSINSSRTNTVTGRVVDVRDRFEATNNFHGGQIGFQTSIHKGPISLTSLTKVHMGNMRQLVNINGAGQRRFLGVPGVETFDTGLYTVGTEGRARQNEFAFAPEANFKLGYRMRNYVNFTVGYSFIYWNRVALSGDQFDGLVDQSRFQNPLAPPPQLPTVKDRGFFVHGIDFGVTIDY